MTVVAGVLARRSSRRLSFPSLALAFVTAAVVGVAVAHLVGAGQLGAALASGRAELLAPGLAVLVLGAVCCERRWPAERRPALARGHVQDAWYLVLHVVAVVPLMTLLGVAFGVLLGGHAHWLELPGTGGWPGWLVVPVTIVLMDGANWSAHWADHRFSVLWRFHALHHSQEELSVLTSFRAHPLSHLAGFCLATVPVVALMGARRGVDPALITGYVGLGTLPHANLRWSFGPVGKVVVSPAYHRLHHSFEGASGLNLGVVLTVWDVLAGRARFPQSGVAPCPTGLPGRPVPTEQADPSTPALATLAAQLFGPFGQPAGPRPGPGSAKRPERPR